MTTLAVLRVVSFALFGLLFGSFANVVIWRVPRGESIVSPGSHCPGCGRPIIWYDNIPIASWLVLRARCRSCGTRISGRYPLVETASGLAFAAASLGFSDLGRAVAAASLFWFLLVLSAIDFDTFRLPNVLVGTLAALGIAGAVVAEVTAIPLVPLIGRASDGLFAHPLAASGLGAVLGIGVSASIAALYGAVRNKSGLGMGDVKLLGALGLFLGPYVVFALFFGSLLGIAAGLVTAQGGGSLSQTKIPFGPWLSAGAALSALFAPALLGWYLQLIGIM